LFAIWRPLRPLTLLVPEAGVLSGVAMAFGTGAAGGGLADGVAAACLLAETVPKRCPALLEFDPSAD